jgi:hypothetical protein
VASSTRNLPWFLAGGAILVIGAAITWYFTQRQPQRKAPGIETLSQAVLVLAAAEDGQFREAIDGWDRLLAEFPEDRELLLNQAVTVLKWIAETNNRLTGGLITDAEQQRQTAAELEVAYKEADRILQRLAETSEAGDGLQAYLESSLLEAQSRSLPFPQDVEVRKQAAQRLMDALQANPAQPLLAARLLDLAQDLSADFPELTPASTEAMLASWRHEPRNLYLLVRAGESMIPERDARLAELLPASLELARPMMSMMGASIQQLKPEEQIPLVVQQIEAGDWANAMRFTRQWLNVLKGTSAFRADTRLVKPDILALLNTSFLHRWRQTLSAEQQRSQSASPAPTGLVAREFELFASGNASGNGTDGASAAGSSAPTLVAWYDHNVDLVFDLLAVRGTQLKLLVSDKGLAGPESRVLEVELPAAARGMLLVDLWDVDSPQRPRVTQAAAPAAAGQAEQPATGQAASAPAAVSSSRHDTLQEILVWSDQGVVVVSSEPEQTGEELASPSAPRRLVLLDSIEGLSSLAGVRQLVPIDIDSDGDLDLIAATDSGLRILQNNGNRTFQDISQYSTLGPDGWIPSRLVVSDYDRDLDLDVVCSSTTAPHLVLLENILHSQFRFQPLEAGAWGSSEPLYDLAVGELDGNASWDWCGLAAGRLEAILTDTPATGVVNPVSRQTHALPAGFGARQLALADLNNDGQLDACIGGAGGLTLQFADRFGQFVAEETYFAGRQVSSLDARDASGDGRIDLLVGVGDAVAVLSVTDGQADSQTGDAVEAAAGPGYVAARVRGINDVNGGGRINHYAIGSVLELWSDGLYQARVIDGPVTHFGLGGRTPQNLRIIFNNGLTQNTERPPANALLEEVQELRGSCPFVYGWNGERFELITDLLWNAPLGLQVARGKTLPDRRWEYLLLPGESMQPKDGAIELHVTEELWEVAYFDHLALTAVDHPADLEVFTNEKVGPPSIAEHRLWTATEPIRPVRAVDGHSREQLDALLQRDRRYAQAFEQQICQGLCEPHTLDLHFEPEALRGRQSLQLVLTGWMFPTDTSLNIGIDQNPEREPPQPPSLWIPDASGEFQCVQPFIGFPGGKPKTIVVPLDGLINVDDARLRIAGSQQIYWDEIYVVADEPEVELRVEPLGMLSADLEYRGFSRLLPRTPHQPHWYDYHQVSTAPKWPPLAGPFTRFGSVKELLQADDDRMVVIGSGDDIRIRFQLPTAALPEGWKRDYVLHSVGWDKDADANTLAGDGSLPLPFKAMSAYPPPASDAEEAQRVWLLNRDTLVERSPFQLYWKRPPVQQ